MSMKEKENLQEPVTAKQDRHKAILDIIQVKPIEKQSQLVKELENLGFQVTQATVSRDIKEMRLMKATTPLGKYIYAQAQNVGDDLVPKRLLRIFSESILSVQQAENIVVVKTFSGSASAVGEAIDGLMWPEIVGTLAGDNTIMIVTRHTQDAGNVAEKITGLMS